MNLIPLTRVGGGSVAVNPHKVSEINAGHAGEHTWLCFKGGGAMPIQEAFKDISQHFAPPMALLTKVSGYPVLVAPDCVVRVEEGYFHGAPAVWINYAPEH